MTKEKFFDADKKPQDDQFDNERLSEEELDGVAGGTSCKKVNNLFDESSGNDVRAHFVTAK